MQEADGDRLDSVLHQLIDGADDIRPGERTLDISFGVDALIDLDTQIAFDQLRRLRPGEVVEARHPERANLEDVAESARGDEARARTFELENRIRGDGRTVQKLDDLGPAKAAFIHHLS